MIASLTGSVKHIINKSLIIDVNGIGFEVKVSEKDLKSIKLDSIISLLIAMQVNDQEITLYGFFSLNDRFTFYDLTSVSGVGPKTAYNLISNLGADVVQSAIANADEASLTAIPGIGSKNAKRILLELKGKYENNGIEIKNNPIHNDQEIVIEALQKLGYRKNEITSNLLNLDNNLTTEEKIKQLLKLL